MQHNSESLIQKRLFSPRKLWLLFLAISSVILFGVALFPQKASAVTDNHYQGSPTAALPYASVRYVMRFVYGQTVFEDRSTGNQCNGFNNAQFAWVSSTGDTRINTVNVGANEDFVNLRFNTVGAICDSIVNSSGNITDMSLQFTRWNLVSSSTSYGSLSGLGGFLDVDYRWAHMGNDRYTGLGHDEFRLSGLRNLPAGQHTIRVNITHRPVNRFTNNNHRCVVRNVPAFNLEGTNCPTTTAFGTVIINKDQPPPPPPPPPVTVSCIGPNVPGNDWSLQPFGSVRISGGVRVSSTRTGTTPANFSISISGIATRSLFNGNVSYDSTTVEDYELVLDGRPDRDHTVTISGQANGQNFSCSRVLTIEPPPPIEVVCTINTAPRPNEWEREPADDITIVGSIRVYSNRPGGTQATLRLTSPLIPQQTLVDRNVDYRDNLTLTNDYTFSLNGRSIGNYPFTVTASAGGETRTCPRTLSLIDKPYFKVFGGDVLTGLGPDDPGFSPSGIFGWNSDTPSQRYRGAGTQLAAIALGVISDFATAQQIGGSNPKQLSFANTITDQYGGRFQAATTPTSTFWPNNVAALPDFNNNWGGTGSNSYKFNGNFDTGAPRQISLRRRITVYVDGNLTISNDIRYIDSYASVSDIPSIRFIVRGNIYVQHNVSELHGMFIALRDGNNTGVFYTCTQGTTVPNPAILRNRCGGQLTVYGAVAAHIIKLDRVHGSLRNSNTNERWNTDNGGTPAEKFIYTPEVWLTSGFSGEGTDNSYGTLPPVL